MIDSVSIERKEQFANLLDIAIINLRETDQHHELGSGSLYSILQRRLPQSMLTSYHRWVFDNNVTQSVVTLRKWVIQESEFLTVASETVYGVAGRASDAQTTPQKPGQRNTRTFFGDNGDNRAKKTSAVKRLEQTIEFGHVRRSNKKVLLKNGKLLSVVSYVSAVWHWDIPAKHAQEVASVA